MEHYGSSKSIKVIILDFILHFLLQLLQGKDFFMNLTELKNAIVHLPTEEFKSSAHATNQHRIFGFTTTNIRSVSTLAGYVIELLPEYISRKNNYEEWERWFKDPDVQELNKQKFRRLELAKILFRNVKDSPKINNIGEKLYRIYETNDKDLLSFILQLYVLTGRYFDVDNQPLVETTKVLSSFSGNFIQEATEELLSNDVGRLTLAMLFYNPAVPEALDIAYELIQNTISPDGIEFLKDLLNTQDSIIYKRARDAGGIKNFSKELAVIVNYYLFKQACEKNFDNSDYETIISDYINSIFDSQLSDYFGISDRVNILSVLLDSPNRIILKDVFEFALEIKFDNHFVRKRERKNMKQEVLEKYGYKCFFDHFATEELDHKAHELNYFRTKKNLTYLEGHHMVQMENSKFFEKDVDILENIIPLCPNCHRKIHNADKETVMKMLKLYYDNSDKQKLIRKGIFVDIDTLARFYGIEGD